MYKLVNSNGLQSLVRIEDNVSIPFDEANTDYQEYIKWTKASPKNVAEPADE